MATYNFLFKKIDDKELKIKGLGKASVNKFKKLGVETLYDLLYFFPRAYEDRSNSKDIKNVLADEFVVVKGIVVDLKNQYIKAGRTMFRAILKDDTSVLELVWFNNKFIKNNIIIGDELLVYGKIKKTAKLQMINPEYRKIKTDGSIIGKNSEQILPIYPSTASLRQEAIRKVIYEALIDYGYLLEENIPLEMIKKEKLISRKEAVMNIHFPENMEKNKKALKRFLMEEILILEMGILQGRFETDRENNNIYELEDNKKLVTKFISNLDYSLTKAQKKVIGEIYKELKAGKIVNRLIQGDVGSGKTVVSLIMLLYMAENSYQGVIMAPTEILATQHYLGVVDEFANLDVRVELLTGSIKGKKREKLLLEIENGLVDIVIGTHALIEDDVVFKKLGLIIIDEQHRFGVDQRRLLREKGSLANLIVMSATPIPRSLALTIYGDLDVSIIDELPLGRIPIKTKWIKSDVDKERMYDFIEKKINEGRQIYVVSPLIEESETLNVKSAEETYEEYSILFKNRRLGLIHGRQKNIEKQEIMRKFKKGEIDILISTTVIEVGVNVPNASIMVIRDAQRFGLSSLHQLRGRVGRGKYQSYCFLESSTENDISGRRLEVMEKIIDGFKIAEEDLKLRNSGEIFGTKQSGISDMVLTDIIKNIKEIKVIRDFVLEHLKNNNGKINNEYLKRDIYEKFHKK
ncbi:MAG: ATP-dependent DNA helicase RecG [Leptotrichiaceae bacterium]|nr:ATP-dependent DNA helicase RecG [Leptotrichiaceae bacterium]MBP6280473.1 ATP-dependent DNA helicase RecG [Leptotrichiaceae bacterium]MBP7099934.1 ATP-dependent DNA helicase RecG [Leptotrichiaceae bacterium]MBP7725321.1 ATP-dependent DNA helicase RecG [Leptotrichiaceae bacterium]MBP9629097.1 ATP-dependent DNA helicase RecG [Leptotrichiaceae bacterium]